MGDEVNAGRMAKVSKVRNAGRQTRPDYEIARGEEAPFAKVGDYVAACTFYRKYPRGSDARYVWQMLRNHWRVVPGTEDHDEIHFAAEYSAAYARLAGHEDDARELDRLREACLPAYIARRPEQRTQRWLSQHARDTEVTTRTIVNAPAVARELRTIAKQLARERGMSWRVLRELEIDLLSRREAW
ncbi:MAG: hypothetical protein IT381_12550 [Deltaproteobacteria bacterium]|nr:hypothetical protein [Deltaproteobacteria bacterium]